MTPVELSDPIYHDEDAARAHLEATRWPEGPVCFHCGSVGEQIRPLKGKSMGAGWYYCGACKDKFTVRMGAVYERSHIPLHKWLLAFRLMASSKKGMSAHQLHRTLNITYKSAWFLAMRVREAMDESASGPLGGGGTMLEADESYHGQGNYEFINGKGWVCIRGPGGMARVVTLVEKGGRARSVKVDDLRAATVRKVILDNVSPDTILHTDEARFYKRIGKQFAGHESVNHTIKEYVRDGVTTNAVEGFFGIFRRGMKGTYQHCSEKHLQRYFNEFDFRYSNRIALGCDDAERTERAVKGAEGKRLKYRQPNSGAEAKA